MILRISLLLWLIGGLESCKTTAASSGKGYGQSATIEEKLPAGIRYKVYLKKNFIDEIQKQKEFAPAAGGVLARYLNSPELRNEKLRCQFTVPADSQTLSAGITRDDTYDIPEFTQSRNGQDELQVDMNAMNTRTKFKFHLQCIDTSQGKSRTKQIDFSDLESGLGNWMIVYALAPKVKPEYWRKMQEIPSADANTPQAIVNAFQSKPSACRIFSEDSNSVADGRVTVNATTNIVGSSSDLLNACRTWAATNPGSCSSLEFAGHAYLLSVGLNNYTKNNQVIFGVNFENDEFKVYPQDPAQFDEIKSCFDKLLTPNAPIIFSTCGGAWDYADGSMDSGGASFYKGKAPAQNRLSELLQRSIYSPISYCCSIKNGMATSCSAGWFGTAP